MSGSAIQIQTIDIYAQYELRRTACVPCWCDLRYESLEPGGPRSRNPKVRSSWRRSLISVCFYVFREVSYAVDVYRGEARGMRSLNNYVCFIAQYYLDPALLTVRKRAGDADTEAVQPDPLRAIIDF